MKKIFLFVLVLLEVSLFLTVPQKANAAGSCTCVGGETGTLSVASNSCSSNSVATCKMSRPTIGDIRVSCDCVESNPGSNCIETGQLPSNMTFCCSGSYLYNPTRTCFKNGTDPYGKPIPTQQPSNLDKITCGTDGNGISTAIGCIPVLGSTNEFLTSILKWATGVGSGIAFLLMLYAGFMIMTAAGNPERIKAGQELLTSAVAGLILLIFAVFILKFIGVDILGLDAFGFGN